MNKLSAVIITQNEQDRIGKTLEALKWCDEIVVVDSGSKDHTVEIAKKFGARVYRNDFDGYGPQKQFATAQTRYPWILAVDADEIVTPELQEEIKKVLENPEDKNGYFFPIANVFLGREIRFWGEGPRLHLRLFHKEHGGFNNKKVHEEVVVRGDVGTLKNKVLHYSYKNVHHYFEKFNHYTTMGAQDLKSQGKKSVSLIELWFRFPIKFFSYYVIRGGFLNGFPGFVWCLFSAFYPTVKYIKLNELNLTSQKLNFQKVNSSKDKGSTTL